MENNERKLAHIEKIISLTPIIGADRIELATILGWQCVVKKGEFKVGDKVIYCEVDSVLPEKPEFEFLRDGKFRIRTIKLKGQVSQGLILPISSLGDFGKSGMRYIGEDITKWLGITKYLSPFERDEIYSQESVKHWTKNYKITKWLWRYKWFRNHIKPVQVKWWPEWISHTDEERIQNIPHVLEQFKDKEVYVTEKIDYQSGTWTGKMVPRFSGILSKLPFKKYQFVVCSRNWTTNDKASLYWKIARKYNLEQILKENPTLTIQGEQGDTKVQDNKYGITEPTMWVFNIIDHERNYYYDYKEMEKFCRKYNLQIVPKLYKCKFNSNAPYYLKDLGSTVQELVEFSKGKSVINPNIEREGIVVRCIENGKKLLSFKVINPNFLLQYKN